MRAFAMLSGSSAVLAACAWLALGDADDHALSPAGDAEIGLRCVAEFARDEGRHAGLDSASVYSLHSPVVDNGPGVLSGPSTRLLELVGRIGEGSSDAAPVRALRDLFVEFPALVELVPELLDLSRGQDRSAVALLSAPDPTTGPASGSAQVMAPACPHPPAVVCLPAVTPPVSCPASSGPPDTARDRAAIVSRRSERRMNPTRDLLLRWHDGDQAALVELVHQEAEWVGAQVRRRLGPTLRRRVETQDIVQNTLLNVLRDGPRFVVSDRDHLRGLLARMVENVLLVQADHHQAQKRDVRREAVSGPSQSVINLDLPADITQPAEAAERNETREWIRLAIELLEPEDRNVVLWREYMDLPFAEIARRLDVAEDAARMRHKRALPKLAKKLELLRAGHLGQLLQDES